MNIYIFDLSSATSLGSELILSVQIKMAIGSISVIEMPTGVLVVVY